MDAEIASGKLCPYCKEKSKYVDSSIVYGKSYGMIYLCKPCGAWVGVHKGTDKALGRLANKELRLWKREAHKWFDGLWEAKIAKGFSRYEARSSAYKWLSEKLQIAPEYTHIGMFDIEQCKNLIELCKNYYKL